MVLVTNITLKHLTHELDSLILCSNNTFGSQTAMRIHEMAKSLVPFWLLLALITAIAVSMLACDLSVTWAVHCHSSGYSAFNDGIYRLLFCFAEKARFFIVSNDYEW